MEGVGNESEGERSAGRREVRPEVSSMGELSARQIPTLRTLDSRPSGRDGRGRSRGVEVDHEANVRVAWDRRGAGSAPARELIPRPSAEPGGSVFGRRWALGGSVLKTVRHLAFLAKAGTRDAFGARPRGTGYRSGRGLRARARRARQAGI